MELLRLICPNSPPVWSGRTFSDCFDHMVLMFGANMLTLFMIFVLAICRRNASGIQRMTFTEKVVLHFIPALGVCLSLVDVTLLFEKHFHGDFVLYHEWLSRSSQLILWTVMIISSKYTWMYIVIRKRLLCFWWIMKSILGTIHLHKAFASLEAWKFLEESSLVMLDIIFSISINYIRIKLTTLRHSSLEDPLLSVDMDNEEGSNGDSVDLSGWWDLMTFKCITSVMNRGVAKQLDFEDLLQLPDDMEPSTCHNKLSNSWADQWSNSNPFLFKAICCAYGWPYLRLGLLKVFNDCIGFVGPLLLNKLIRFLQQGSLHWDGYLIALSLGLTSIVKSFFDTQYTFHLAKLKLKLRSGIMTLIYHKCLCVTLAERSKFSEGEIQTFMSVDADRTVNFCNSFHDMWSLPFQIGVALFLLYTQVKFAFVSGLAITILLIPVNKWISGLIAGATGKMMTQKDERIRRSGEILTHIRTIKMYSWEQLFSSWVMKTRTEEVKHLATRKYLDAWCVFFWATTPTLFSLFTFGLYTLMGYQLDAATVFTCLALFNNLISPLNSFPWVINGLIDAFISTRRLSRFLCCQEWKRQVEQIDESPSAISNSHFDFTSEDIAVKMHDACSTWSSNDEKEWNLVLNNVTLYFPKGTLIAIVGEFAEGKVMDNVPYVHPSTTDRYFVMLSILSISLGLQVGSGKSSLLSAILGEMRLIHGSISSSRCIAYVPQVPWILSGTIRDNILFGESYDPKRYLDTIKACALDVDISLMPDGDMSYIGEKGVNLSGGQRARLALARAIYQIADIYMLDDVLSAVDAQVARWILHNAILGPLLSQKTCLLCTHNVQAISAADMVVIMDKGHVRCVENSTDMTTSKYSTLSVQNEFDTLSYFQEQEQSTSVQERPGLPDKASPRAFEEAQEIVEVELRKKGKVEFGVYKKYASFAGWLITFVICFSALVMQASRNGNDLWLSYWVDKTGRGQTKFSTSFYLVVLCIFCIVNSFLTLVRAFSFAFGGLQAAVQVHNALLNKLVGAPVKFFDQTPGGRILNRLSSDLYTIDDSLPFIINILLANLVGLLGIAIVLSYVQVLFLLLLLPFWFIYGKLQFFYRTTSRELRRLDSVSRSPIYAIFTETLDGSPTIRAFNTQEIFLRKFAVHVALYQRTSYSEIIASLWLSLRLQLLAALIISFVAVMAVVGCYGYLPISFGTPGLVGLALSYAAPIVSLLGSFLTSFTETEKEMVSVERALQYMDIPQEVLGGCQSLNPNWPHQGLIEFQHVTMRYLPSLPPALHNVTFKIPGGMQVGIVGRTGAGKSSVLNALFRLVPISSGHILVDGLNIVDIPVRDLRAHLAIVPQSPFLFEGSLRDNLDPLQISCDLKIWETLEKCSMKEQVEAAGGLGIHVRESGSSFSVGQRQLLCLARALLKSSKVLCLDECTANVDTQTASVLQNAISSECSGVTVLTIAHRISTVLSMDNILILDRGNLVEQGNPRALLQDELSKFSSFAKASTM